MFALIDRENMTLIGKHVSQEVLNSFAWIELSHVGSIVCFCESPAGFHCFSLSELKKLYKNLVLSSNWKIENWSREAYMTLVCSAIMRCEELDCVEHEVIRQAQCLSQDDDYRCMYVKGYLTPEPGTADYEPITFTTDSNEEEEIKAEHAVVPELAFADIPTNVKREGATSQRIAIIKPVVDYSTVAPLPCKQPWL